MQYLLRRKPGRTDSDAYLKSILRETGDLLVQDPITNGYILSYIGLVAERVNYGAEYCTAKKPDPITCGLKEYRRVLNEYRVFQVN